MDLIFQPKLKRIALHATALMLWNQTDVQKIFKFYLLSYHRKFVECYLNDLTEEVIKKINQDSLPISLCWELILIVKDLGFKMAAWFLYLTECTVFRDEYPSQVYSKLFKTIHWTHFGSINEKETLKCVWLKNSTVDLRKVYVMACCYCLQDVIEDLWKKISQKKPLYSYKDLCKKYEFHLVAYWNKSRENDLRTFINDVIVPNSGANNLYDSSKSVEVNMLKLSVKKGYVPAVKYFWGKITQREKDENLKFLLHNSFDFFFGKLSDEIYRIEKYTEISMFLMNFLSKCGKGKFFTNSPQQLMNVYNAEYRLKIVLGTICCKWPWDQFFQFLLTELRDYCDFPVYQKLAEDAVHEIYESWKLGIPVNQSPAQRRLHQIWYSTPFSIRGELFQKFYKNYLFLCGDICTFKLMINDKYVTYKKPEIVKLIKPNLMKLAEEGKYEFFFEFVKELCGSIELDKNVQVHSKLVYQLILEGDFKAADEILACYSHQDKVFIKNEMDVEIFCLYFIFRHQYDTAEEFLKWKFDSDLTEIKKIKDNFEDLIINHMGYTWKRNDVSIAKINSENALLWLFGSEIKVLYFKQKSLLEILIWENVYKSSWISILFTDRFDILENFTNWCSLNTSDDMKILKWQVIKRMSYDKDEWFSVLEKYIKKNEVEKSEKFLTFWFDSENEKIDFMNNFLLSRWGIAACRFFIRKHINLSPFKPKMEPLKLTQKFKEFIDFFIKPYLKNFDKFRRKLGNRKESLTFIADSRTICEGLYTYLEPYYREWGICFDVNKISEYKLFLTVLSSAEQEKNS